VRKAKAFSHVMASEQFPGWVRFILKSEAHILRYVYCERQQYIDFIFIIRWRDARERTLTKTMNFSRAHKPFIMSREWRFITVTNVIFNARDKFSNEIWSSPVDKIWRNEVP